MASKKTLNLDNLAALGPERLAAILIEVAAGNAEIKRRLRLELAACRLELQPDGPALVARILGLEAPEVGSVVKVGVVGGVVAFPG